jgi:RNase P subunit RPR2
MQKFKDNACPECETVLGYTACINDEEAVLPESGDITICSNCGAIAKFTDDLTLASLTEDEKDRYSKADPASWEMTLQASAFVKSRKQ